MVSVRMLNPFRRRITVAVDLVRLLPGGENGGVKQAVFAFLNWAGRQEGSRVHFILIGNKATKTDLELLARPGDEIWCSHRTAADPDPGKGLILVDTDRLIQAGVDLLYNPFGPDRLGGGRIPFVSLLIDLLHREVPEALPQVEREHRERFYADACARAAAVQVISDDVANRLVGAYGLERARIFRTWLPLQQIETPDLARGGIPALEGDYFLYPANFWPHKNHGRLLEAYRRYLDRTPDRSAWWSLVLTGSGPDPFVLLDPLVDELALGDFVYRVGYLDRPDYLATVRQAGGLVYPSLNEGFGIPLLEAQQAGVPVVCSNLGSLPEVAGEGALLFNPRDVDEIAAALVSLAGDDGLRQRLIEKGALNLNRFDFKTESRLFLNRLRDAAGCK